jgi:hypothetical protein
MTALSLVSSSLTCSLSSNVIKICCCFDETEYNRGLYGKDIFHDIHCWMISVTFKGPNSIRSSQRTWKDLIILKSLPILYTYFATNGKLSK